MIKQRAYQAVASPHSSSRRDVLRFLTLTLGISLTPSCTRAVLELGEASSQSVVELNEPAKKMLADLCDLMLPATKTPGALDAGVPDFLEALYSNWMTAAERADFDAGLNQIAQLAVSENEEFVQADRVRQQALLQQAFDDLGDADQQVASLQSDEPPFLLRLRNLVVTGFYTSRVGATQALDYHPVPGYYDGEVKL